MFRVHNARPPGSWVRELLDHFRNNEPIPFGSPLWRTIVVFGVFLGLAIVLIPLSLT